MLKKLIKIMLLSCSIMTLGLAYAADHPATATTQVVYCPAIKNIKKDNETMTWASIEHNFKSYNKSFSNTLKSFVGAQWTGANVGQVTCVYKGTEANTFPVLLIFHTLTLEPMTANWGKNQGGYRDCSASQQTQCPFVVRLKQKQQDLYQEAEKLKSGDTNGIDSEPGY